ncbi:CCA tRNA nucleotidyltransferase [Calidifontibacillus oryziterrae]|uniref:CCA tRNA nucleotidyltransferase n=1 Tax=Calidifontibacillus oryziterrae TaxID=1191699 RepID=UPI0002E34F73|nr:CCA tRNA nucleotidyltransferase [Calidifontibacillus oryziterrae]
MDQRFIKAKPILRKLIDTGHEAYFVGGSVRDSLLKRPIGDVDIATSARPEHVQSLFDHTIPVGIEHGTVIVVVENETYEVTTFRLEGEYADYRHPSYVEFVSSLKKDLSRRDFTINAIAMDMNGMIIDPYEGKKDINRKLIQTVGNPDERFREDPLRMMRALRFVSQLDFKLSENTMDSIKNNATLLTKISIERILTEFDKLLIGKANHTALEQLIQLGLHEYLPCLGKRRCELQQFALLCKNRVDTIEEYWSLLVHTLRIENIDKFFKNWKCSNERIKICKIYSNGLKELEQSQILTLNFVYKYGKAVCYSIIKLYSIVSNQDYDKLVDDVNELSNKLPITSRKELAISGKDLLNWYNLEEGGPWISEMIEKVEQAVVENKVKNEKTAIREWVTACSRQSENNC